MRLPETAIEVTEADDGDLFLRVLDEALDALHTADIPFLLIGGIGSAVYGRDHRRVGRGHPAIFNVFNLGRVSAITDGTGLTGPGVEAALWASFWTILGGFLASGLGGMIGGAVTMPANAQLQPPATDRIVRVADEERDADDDVDADHESDGRVRDRVS